MLLNKDDFIRSHAKAAGLKSAAAMYDSLNKEPKEKPIKVYISPTGGEIHVNGPVAASTKKPETLQEKIARFDRLAAQVVASRAVCQGIAAQFTRDDDDIDPESDDFGDVVETDDFGEIIEKPVVQPKAGADDGSGQQIIDGDEPSRKAAPSAADPAKPSAMDDGGDAAE